MWLPNQVDDALGFQIAGHPEKGSMGGRWMSFSPGYLDVFRIPILRGRDFRETDTLAAPGVALINQALANKYWAGEDPVGQHIQVGTGMGGSLTSRREPSLAWWVTPTTTASAILPIP